jgi:hypothetical protein
LLWIFFFWLEYIIDSLLRRSENIKELKKEKEVPSSWSEFAEQDDSFWCKKWTIILKGMSQISNFNKSWRVFVYLKLCQREEGDWIGLWSFVIFSLCLVGRK